jgi:RNA polymerase sigma-70 factor (ECF subfamily)
MIRADGGAASQRAEQIARESYGRLLAHLASAWRDVTSAEDALAEAFEAALTFWPERGVPDNPVAWLASAARRKLLDQSRRRRVAKKSEDHVIRQIEELATAEADPNAIMDRRLALMLVCAHPAIDPGIRAPLMMQTVLGVDAARIASAYLVAPATMGQRLSRAKAKIKDAGIPFAFPDLDEHAERIGSVLDALYGAFAIAHDEAFADDPFGRGLADEAIWLARVVVSLTVSEPEPLGLLALFLFIHARRGARRGDDGQYIPLSEQDASQWQAALIDEAEAHLLRAAERRKAGRFQLEAAIQSAHCARRDGAPIAWPAIATLYAHLQDMTASRIVAVNRAMAVAEAGDLSEALAMLRAVEAEGGLESFQPFWAAKAELHARHGLTESAASAYDRAIGLERDPAVRDFLLARKDGLTVRK